MSVSPFEDKYSVTIERHIAWSPQLSLLSLLSLKKHTQQIINPSCFLATNQGNGCKRCSRQTAYIPPLSQKCAGSSYPYIRNGFFILPVIQVVNIITQIALRKLCNKITVFLSYHQTFRSRIEKLLLSRNVYLH